MERLTTRIAGTATMAFEHEEQHTLPEWLDIVHARLADYEDTGLDPQEINALKLYAMGATVAEIKEFDGVPIARLQELAKAEKEGRLFIVPAPGDVLYETDPEHGVVKHTVTDVHWVSNTSAVDDNGMAWADYYTEEDIETAHHNREAAEAVLAAGSIMEG